MYIVPEQHMRNRLLRIFVLRYLMENLWALLVIQDLENQH